MTVNTQLILQCQHKRMQHESSLVWFETITKQEQWLLKYIWLLQEGLSQYCFAYL